MQIEPFTFALLGIPGLVIAVVLHEIAHGWVALQLGDPTAKLLGRLTLNPLKHVDPVLTLLIPGVLIFAGSPIIFGGAKPVPVDPSRFKDPRRGMAIVAIAGPVTNFILAAGSYLFGFLFIWIGVLDLFPPTIAVYVYLAVAQFIIINVVLGVFNLFPVPPLDGGRIAVGVLPKPLAYPLARLEPYGFFIIVGLLYSGIFDEILGPVIEYVFSKVM
jgi:Zn-dependent protease